MASHYIYKYREIRENESQTKADKMNGGFLAMVLQKDK